MNRDRQRILLVGNVSKVFLDADAVAANCEVCDNISDAINTLCGTGLEPVKTRPGLSRAKPVPSGAEGPRGWPWYPKEIVIIGVEPGRVDWGLELTDKVKQKLAEIIDTVLKEIEDAVHGK